MSETNFTAESLHQVVRSWIEDKDPEFGEPRGEGWVKDVQGFREGFDCTNTGMNARFHLWLHLSYGEQEQQHAAMLQKVATETAYWFDRELYISCNLNPEDKRHFDMSLHFSGNPRVLTPDTPFKSIRANQELCASIPLAGCA